MNEFDQFVKHKLKAKYYIRYADDFVILSESKDYLKNLIQQIKHFLKENLKLDLHPNKVFVKTLASGVDFLGWVHFPDHRILRTMTKRRMLKRILPTNNLSYIGLLSHGNTWKIREIAENKMEDLNANNIEAAMKIVEGTARSMGIEVTS